ncbi:MAG TPA: serine protease, partial [Kofleriaceae bacterium]|nr:serine protease [Kofleriaceae bacterium]
MKLRGVIADAEAIGDQLVRQTFGQQLHDLTLALGQLASTFAIAGLDRSGGHELMCESGIDHGEATANGGERGLDAGPDLIAEDDTAGTRGESRRHVGVISHDGDDRDVQGTNFGETRERLFAVDPGIPQSDFSGGLVDHVDRTDLREQTREPGAQERIVGHQDDLDRLVQRAQRELWIAGHGSGNNMTTLDVRVNPAHAGRTDPEPGVSRRETCPERALCPLQTADMRRSRKRAGWDREGESQMAQPALDVFHALDSALAAAVAAAAPSTVRIARGHGQGGTGIAWSEDLVVTSSFHCPDKTTVGIAQADGNLDERDAEVIGRDPGTDLAVLRVTGGGLVPAQFRELDGLAVGNLALAIGRPGKTARASLRAIGVLGPEVDTPRGGTLDRYVESDRQIPRGFAGGPLIDADGKVIGLNTRTLLR